MHNIILALVLLIVTGNVFAKIAHFSTGDGELFLVVRDHARQESYVRGLGMGMNQFMSMEDKKLIIKPDAEFKRWLKAWPKIPNVLQWSVLAGDSKGHMDIKHRPKLLDPLRVMSTASMDKDRPFTLKAVKVRRMQVLDTLYLANVNSLIKEKKSAVFTKGTPAYFDFALDTWSSWAPFSAMAEVGHAQEFYLLEAETMDQVSPAKINRLGQWLLSPEGVLSYSAADTTEIKQASIISK